MGTYRKFDKYRARTDFSTDEQFGFGLPANKWISSGVGTPVAPVAGNGVITVGTSAADNDSVYLQRGIESGATKSSPLVWTRHKKFAIVANFRQGVPADVGFDADFLLGFFTANAAPNTQAGIGMLYDHTAKTITCYVGTPGGNALQYISKTLTDFDINEHASEGVGQNQSITAEVYCDGAGHVGFYVGKTRVGGITLPEDFFAANTQLASLASVTSPTIGFINASAAAHTFAISAIGVAIQNYVDRASDEV
jgi:hypothetical protein